MTRTDIETKYADFRADRKTAEFEAEKANCIGVKDGKAIAVKIGDQWGIAFLERSRCAECGCAHLAVFKVQPLPHGKEARSKRCRHCGGESVEIAKSEG